MIELRLFTNTKSPFMILSFCTIEDIQKQARKYISSHGSTPRDSQPIQGNTHQEVHELLWFIDGHLALESLCSHTPVDSKPKVDDGPLRRKKNPETAIKTQVYWGGGATYREPRSSQLDKAAGPTISMQQTFIVQQLSLATICSPSLPTLTAFQGDQGLPNGHSSLQGKCSRLATFKSLTFNAKHVFLHILLDGNIEEGQDFCILKIVINRDIQGCICTNQPSAGTIQSPFNYTIYNVHIKLM